MYGRLVSVTAQPVSFGQVAASYVLTVKIINDEKCEKNKLRTVFELISCGRVGSWSLSSFPDAEIIVKSYARA